MIFKKEYIVRDEKNEWDWNVDAVLKDYPELASAGRDDPEQKLLDSALTPYIYKKLVTFENAVTNSFCVISNTLTDLEANKVKELEEELELPKYKSFDMFILLLTINILLGFFVIAMLM